MLGALIRWLLGPMQRKAEKDEAEHSGERRRGLGLRGHAGTEGLAASEMGKRRRELPG